MLFFTVFTGNVTQDTKPQETGEELHKTSNEFGEESSSGHAGDAYDEGSLPVPHGANEERDAGDLPHALPEMAGLAQRDQKGVPNDPPHGKREAGAEARAADDPHLSHFTAQMSVSERGNVNRGDDGEQEEWKEKWGDEMEEEKLSRHLWPSSKPSFRSSAKSEVILTRIANGTLYLQQVGNQSLTKITVMDMA